MLPPDLTFEEGRGFIRSCALTPRWSVRTQEGLTRTIGRYGSVVLLTLLCLCLAPASSQAGSGRLDPGFGEQGRAFTSFGITDETGGVEVVTSPDGSAALASRGAVIRFGADGARDRQFGEGGRISLGRHTASGGVEQRTFFPKEVATDTRGRLLVFGEQTDSRESVFGISPTPASSALVLRFTQQGRPDRSFGAGSGFVRADFGLGSDVGDTDIPMVGALAGAADSEDRPLLVAGVSAVIGGCYGKAITRSLPRAVVRLTQDGQLDASFGSGGLSPIEGSNRSPSLAIDASNGPLVSVGRFGGPAPGCESGGVLLRMGEGGQLLSGFGADGARVVTGYSFAVLEPSGATILSRRNNRSIGVLRLRSDGTRDSSFGNHGVANVALPSIVGSHLRPVAVDAKGRILIAGFVGSPSARHARRQPEQSAFVVARLLSNGKLDTSFGTHGRILTRFARPLEVTAVAATLDAQGRLVVAGRVAMPKQGGGFVVARYLLGP